MLSKFTVNQYCMTYSNPFQLTMHQLDQQRYVPDPITENIITCFV